jgi:CRISPR-associated protein Csx14
LVNILLHKVKEIDGSKETLMPEYKNTMLATLGGQPQIVTFTLDLLLQRGIYIEEVIVIHPQASQPRLQHSLACLNAEFTGDRYRLDGRTVHFRTHVLRNDEQPLDDIIDDISANGALNTIHSLIRDLKQQHRRIHLSVTGGRRLMSLLAVSAALLNFDHFDRIWHIYTPEAIRQLANEGTLMHMPSDAGIQLIEGPFAFLGPYFPNLPQYPNADARTVIRTQIAQVDAQERAHCDQVAKHKDTTPRELQTLRAFARGLTPQQVANELGVTPKTIDTYKTRLLDRCRDAWPEEEQQLNYHFLFKKFASYFNDIDTSIHL